MTVGTKQKLAFQNEELFLTINSEQLQHFTCEKLLGIKIDSNLNWKKECDLVLHLNNFPKQHSNNQLKAKYNTNKKVALIQDLNIS
jgi:hypothetical protein